MAQPDLHLDSILQGIQRLQKFSNHQFTEAQAERIKGMDFDLWAFIEDVEG